ncbi:Protein of unknown function [Butyrivibrio sp. Su6]|jgi:hypothetical protein|uniref:DUF2281 domain-containing protein n=1 Tax=Butyrivibrio sp. Su6 TaxID=1520810 RepID=UPI00089F009A|nr:DUF2281 domain-containing protein [Butyrivibrio sp. Su6]SEG45783.1 Protein of unknown function [Butyrivibrio sp. Su6]
MAYAELIEEAKKLSEDNIPEVIDFIRFLNSKQDNKKERQSNLLSGKLKYMADDFDETPDCFKEYM